MLPVEACFRKTTRLGGNARVRVGHAGFVRPAVRKEHGAVGGVWQRAGHEMHVTFDLRGVALYVRSAADQQSIKRRSDSVGGTAGTGINPQTTGYQPGAAEHEKTE